ncbi:hypothetical protein RKD23_007764 [Streptomyces sp. SAI-170]
MPDEVSPHPSRRVVVGGGLAVGAAGLQPGGVLGVHRAARRAARPVVGQGQPPQRPLRGARRRPVALRHRQSLGAFGVRAAIRRLAAPGGQQGQHREQIRLQDGLSDVPGHPQPLLCVRLALGPQPDPVLQIREPRQEQSTDREHPGRRETVAGFQDEGPGRPRGGPEFAQRGRPHVAVGVVAAEILRRGPEDLPGSQLLPGTADDRVRQPVPVPRVPGILAAGGLDEARGPQGLVRPVGAQRPVHRHESQGQRLPGGLVDERGRTVQQPGRRRLLISAPELHHAPQPVQFQLSADVRGPGQRLPQQRVGQLRAARLPGGLGRRGEPLAALLLRGPAQQRGPVQYSRGHGESAPAAHGGCAGLQRFGQRLVGAGGRERAVPHGPLALPTLRGTVADSSASVQCAGARRRAEASAYTVARTSGCLKGSRAPDTSSRYPAASTKSSACSSTAGRRAAASTVPVWPLSFAAATSSTVRADSGSSRVRSAKASRSRRLSGAVPVSTTFSATSAGLPSRTSSCSASGLPPTASATAAWPDPESPSRACRGGRTRRPGRARRA